MLVLLLLLGVTAVWLQQPSEPEPEVAARQAEPKVEAIATRQASLAVPARPDAAACTSSLTNGLVKQELFQRAARIRGRDQAVFPRIAASSFIRIAPPLETALEDPRAVRCRAAVTIDLPPGIAVPNGGRTLAAELVYRLVGDGADNVAALVIFNGDRIAAPLATLAQIAQPVEMAAADPAAAPVPPRAPAAATPAPTPPEAASAPATPPAAPPRVAQVAAAKPPAQPTAKAKAKPAAPTFQTASVNCRFAKRSWETAICSNANLAALDRHLTLFYNQSWRNADTAKRERMSRSSYQFITRRNACSSDGCVRSAYLDRMKEVAAILGSSQKDEKGSS